ncbi:8389_t:CDS:2, partial [Ambispora leptoticha]
MDNPHTPKKSVTQGLLNGLEAARSKAQVATRPFSLKRSTEWKKKASQMKASTPSSFFTRNITLTAVILNR